MIPKKYKLGIFLEAGGNMVFFSNGVLKALREQKIIPEYLVGFSSSSALMFGEIFNCQNFVLEEFGRKIKKNEKNFYFFKKRHFPHNRIYQSAVKNMFENFGQKPSAYRMDFTIIAGKTSKKFAKIKSLLAFLVLIFYEEGIDIRKYFNKIFRIELFEAGSEFKNKPEDLLNIIMGSSCLYPFIKLHFYERSLVAEGSLVNPGHKKYLENCEKGIVIHTGFGKTKIKGRILHIYSSQKIPFNVLDYTDESKLEIMQKAGEEEVNKNLETIKNFLKTK